MTERKEKKGQHGEGAGSGKSRRQISEMTSPELRTLFGHEIDPTILEFPLVIGDDVPDPINAIPLLIRLLCGAENGSDVYLTSADELAIDDLLGPAGANFEMLKMKPAEALAGFAELRRLAELGSDNRIHELTDLALAFVVLVMPNEETVRLALERVRKLSALALANPSHSQVIRYASSIASARLQIKLSLFATEDNGDVFWRYSRQAGMSSNFLGRMQPAVYDLEAQISYSKAIQDEQFGNDWSENQQTDNGTFIVEDLRIPDPEEAAPHATAQMLQRHARNMSGDRSEQEDAIAGKNADPSESPHGHIIVVPKLATGRRDVEWQSKQLKSIAGHALPLIRTPDLKQVRTDMVARHPHLADVIDSILKSLAPHEFVKFPPTLLVGNPGCGKSTLASDIGRALGLPNVSIDVAGMSDSMVLGSSRKWGNGMPGITLQTIMDHGCANPLLIIDEIEKAGGSERNGDFRQQLLGLLEVRTASCYVDRFLEMPTNYSGLVWIFTANDLDPISHPLRSRMRILCCPNPTLEHMPILAANLLRAEYASRGLDQRWATPLTGEELDAIAEHWQGGVRDLKRYVGGVVDARDWTFFKTDS